MISRIANAAANGLSELLASWAVAAIISVVFYSYGADAVISVFLPWAILGFNRSINDAWGEFTKALAPDNHHQ